MGNEKLTVKYDFVWDVINDAQKAEVMAMGEDYKAFMDASKTERTCTDEIVRRAKEAGYVDINTVTKLEKGDKVYSTNRGKNVVLAVIGEEPVANGVNIVGSHIDSPRLDLKQNPLIENGGMAMFKTHYYGGVRKYQWVALPLALYGVVIMLTVKRLKFPLVTMKTIQSSISVTFFHISQQTRTRRLLLKALQVKTSTQSAAHFLSAMKRMQTASR